MISAQEDLYENKTNHFNRFNARTVGDCILWLRHKRKQFDKQQGMTLKPGNLDIRTNVKLVGK